MMYDGRGKMLVLPLRFFLIKGTMEEGFITRTATVVDMFLNELPQGVTLLPEDWEGETERVTAKFAISQQAIKNIKFDVEGFIRAKLNNTLTAIRQRRGIKELRLTHRFHCIIDPKVEPEKTKVYFHIEYAKEL
jgi:hypothetical protein